MHPRKEDPEAPLWPTRGPNASGRMVINSLDDLVRKYSERAGIGPVHPHLLRHSRATHLASHLTEAMLNQVFGWVQGSGMPSVYVHLSGRDVDKALLKAHGIAEEDVEAKKEDTALKPSLCPRCKTQNPPGFKFCGKCSMVLSPEGMVELEQETGETATAAKVAELLVKAIAEKPEIIAMVKEELQKGRAKVAESTKGKEMRAASGVKEE